MLRFSHCAVPVGKVPSTGIALTGSESPSPMMIGARTFWTNSGACAGTGGVIAMLLVAASGTLIWWRWSKAASTAAKFFFTTDSPRLP